MLPHARAGTGSLLPQGLRLGNPGDLTAGFWWLRDGTSSLSELQ